MMRADPSPPEPAPAPEIPRVKKAPVLPVCSFGTLVFLALAIGIFVNFSTREFVGLAFSFELMICAVLAAFVGVATALAVLAVWFLVSRGWWPYRLGPRAIGFSGLAVFVAILATQLYAATPRQRYRSLVGVAAEQASEIEVSGFNSFLASRWLLSFKLAPEHVPAIVSRWGLKEIPPIPLRDRLRSDLLAASGAAQNAPGAEGTRCFVSTTETGDSSVSWITLVVRESDSRVWFFEGHQN